MDKGISLGYDVMSETDGYWAYAQGVLLDFARFTFHNGWPADTSSGSIQEFWFATIISLGSLSFAQLLHIH